jgi:hypothetical protein
LTIESGASLCAPTVLAAIAGIITDGNYFVSMAIAPFDRTASIPGDMVYLGKMMLGVNRGVGRSHMVDRTASIPCNMVYLGKRKNAIAHWG